MESFDGTIQTNKTCTKITYKYVFLVFRSTPVLPLLSTTVPSITDT